MTFEEWYGREGNHKVVESKSIWSSEDVKKMLEASWISACDTCNIEKDAIINYLKKEVIKKSSYKQVMKRQYRELKQKYDAKKDCVHVSELIPYTQSLVIPLLEKHLEEQKQIFCSGKDTKICEEAKFQINMTLAVLAVLS